MIGQRPPGNESHHHKTGDCESCGRAVLLHSLTLLLSTQVPFPNKTSCFVSTCVSSDNSFPSVRQEPNFGPWKGVRLPATNGDSGGTLLHWDWHPDHSGYSGASLPANGPDPAAATGTLLSLVSSWRGPTGQSAPTGKEQETLFTPLPFPLSLLSLTLPIIPHFSSPLVLDAGIWMKGPQPELRIGDGSPPLGRELEFWFWSGLISGRAEFQSSLLWRPREKSHNAWISVGGRRRL